MMTKERLDDIGFSFSSKMYSGQFLAEFPPCLRNIIRNLEKTFIKVD